MKIGGVKAGVVLFDRKFGMLTARFASPEASRSFYDSLMSQPALTRYVKAAHFVGKHGPGVSVVPAKAPSARETKMIDIEALRGRTLVAHLTKVLAENREERPAKP